MLRRIALIPLFVAAAAVAGCSNKVTLPQPDEMTQGYNVYTGPLDPLGRNLYLITLDSARAVQASLAGVVYDNPLRSLDTQVLTLELGYFDGTTCVALETAETAPRFSAAIQRYFEAGTYCVAVSDQRGMAQQVGVVLRVVAPPFSVVGGAPGTDTISTTITRNGRVTRSFEASTAGTVAITLSSVSPSNAVTGIAIGLQDPSTGNCVTARTVFAPPGSSPQLTVPVEAGFYCAAVYDIGNYTSNQTFSLSIAHP